MVGQLGRCSEGADRDEVEAFAAACGENLWQGLNAAGWVGDSVVENDYGSRGEIFFYKPADVPHGRMYRIVRVGGAEHAFVAAGLRQTELSGAGNTAGRAKELGPSCYAEEFLGLFQVTEESGIGVEQKRTVREVVIGNLVASGFDARNQVGMAEGALTDQEEGGLGVVLLENFQDLRGEDGVRAVIKREGDEGMAGAHAIGEIGGEPLEDRDDAQRLYPEDVECEGK